MPKRATATQLSEKEQEELTRLTKRHRSEQQVVLRARIILAAAQGSSNIQIASDLDINFDVVSGRVIKPSWGPTRTEQDALAHLQRLIASDPEATKWHIMLDNLNIHQSEALVLWAAQREGIAPETLGFKGKSGILQSMESPGVFA